MPKIIKRISLLILFQLLALWASASVFTVTTNADAGTGTLREALTLAAANGTTDADVINFNLPDLSEAGRTITLLSQLPDVTSNITIDASTQPGTVFGLSTARVQLLPNFDAQPTFYGLALVQVQDVAIFGLYIKNIRPYPGNANSNYWQGIAIRSSKNITIGAAGKGNVISGFNYDIGINVHLTGGQIQYYGENLTLKGNFVGIEADGITLSALVARETGIAFTYGQVNIGGNLNEGNLFPKGLSIYQANTLTNNNPNDNIYTLPATIKIRYNKIGTNLAGTQKIAGSTGLNMSTVNPGGKNLVDIEDNVITSNGYGINILNNGYQVNIKRNYVGTDRTLNIKLPLPTGIFVYWADNVLIGGATEDANYIANCKPVQIWPFSKAIVSKNSFFCTVGAYPMIFDTFGTRPYPFVKISGFSTTFIKGTSTPNATIELFYSDACGTCSPETYFGSTTSDAAGNWQYDGPINPRTVIASATLDNFTSEFTRVLIDVSNIKISYTCTNTGSITGAVPSNASNVQWFDEQGNVVGNTADLLNVPPGKYKLKAYGGDCNTETSFFEVRKSFTLNAANVVRVNPSCGNPSGSIKGITTVSNVGVLKYSWTDAGSNEVGQSLDLVNIKAGSYTLSVSSANNSCVETYGPVVLQNTSGPNLNESGLVVTASSCKNNTGAITGITATGTGNLVYKWKNAQGVQVGNTINLTNQPAGSYTLEVSDNSTCGSISTPAITIAEINGIVLNDIGSVKPATCGNKNGGITGVTVTGATTYDWFDISNNLVATTTTAVLDNVAAGSYYLVAYNASCDKKSKIYVIPDVQNTTDYGTPQNQVVNASCNLNNGSITLTFNGQLPITYRWLSLSSGQTVGTNGNSLTNLSEGTYQLYGADANQCEKLIGTYSVAREPELALDDAGVQVIPDHCNVGEGKITGLLVTGKTPFGYQWTNSVGTVMGTNLELTGLTASTYQLSITDGVNCHTTASYTVANQDRAIAEPSIKNLEICGPGNIVLNVANVTPQYGYRLYDTPNSQVPIDEQALGRFAVNVNGDRSYFVTQYVGNCESTRKEVKITVGYSSVQIPNSFTPNGDGVNDNWVISGAEAYPKMSVTLFNRNGAKVYESVNYKNDFNGMANGHRLAIGTYYYMLSINNGCKAISGSLTIFR